MSVIEKIVQPKIDVKHIRSHFPILSRSVNGKPLVYFDNAATTQKPQVVIDAICNYYLNDNSNIHRGVHYLSQQATQAYEDSREKVRSFINAENNYEIIFTKGTTDGINLIANSFGATFLSAGDEIIISELEHHSNIVPWQMLVESKGVKLVVAPINDSGEILVDEFIKLITNKTKLVSISHISNALGTINPVKNLISIAHEHGVPVLVDGAQAIQHTKVDVRELDCDFYVFSAHKLFSSTGVGVLYGKEKFLNAMNPYQGGGDMIKTVSFEKTTYNDLPHKFEAGTPNIEAVITLGVAIDYINSIGIESIEAYEQELLKYAHEKLSHLEGIQFIGTAGKKASLVSFLIEGIHPYDIGVLLDNMGIAIRTGHHCAQPIMDKFKIPGTARASFAFYNTFEEIDFFVDSLKKVIKMLK